MKKFIIVHNPDHIKKWIFDGTGKESKKLLTLKDRREYYSKVARVQLDKLTFL